MVTDPNPRMNVLFIAVDDLRCQLGCYGDKFAVTPHIDTRLAGRGTLFTHAYCQQAVCNASRSSLMTGLRPDTIKIGGGFPDREGPEESSRPSYPKMHFRSEVPDAVTLSQHFRLNGYYAFGVGKIYHGHPWCQDPLSWSEPMELNVVPRRDVSYVLPENKIDNTPAWPGLKLAATECADVPDNAYVDGKVTDEAVRVLNKIQGRPFFLAVGFRKPHLPFSAPKRYWDLYDRDDLAVPANPDRPDDVTALAFHSNAEVRGYADVPSTGPISPDKIAELRHGYYACSSYMDAQVGRLLDELDRLSLADHTVVVLWGDHGYHLGEKDLWCKFTCFELDTHAPLVIYAPGRGPGGVAIDAPVEFVDIYPTLCELCELPVPKQLEGASMAPLLRDPARPWKQAAFSQYPREYRWDGQVWRGRTPALDLQPDECPPGWADDTSREQGFMGRTLRTRRYRYTEWVDVRTNLTHARELYDHTDDSAEIENLAERPECGELGAELGQLLWRGWRAAGAQ